MLNFFIGVIVGGAVGVAVMCIAMSSHISEGRNSEKTQSTKPDDTEK